MKGGSSTFSRKLSWNRSRRSSLGDVLETVETQMVPLYYRTVSKKEAFARADAGRRLLMRGAAGNLELKVRG